MKILSFLLLILLIFNIKPNSSGITGPGLLKNERGFISLSDTISTDTYICDDTVLVTEDIVVLPGARLSICPGTTMLFTGPYMLKVEGSLYAAGSPGDSIVFTAENKTEGWKNIVICEDDADSTILKYCRVEYGKANAETGSCCGGGLAIWYNDKVLVSHCMIAHCWAFGRGGGIFIGEAQIRVEYCEFHHNISDEKGGGMAFNHCYPEISDNKVHHNFATVRGGGLYCIDSAPRLGNNIFYSNTAGTYGGGICLEGEFMGLHTIFQQNLIYNNQAQQGGGIYFNDALPVFFVNTICNNQATDGGGIKMEDGSPVVWVNGCILWGNTGEQISLVAAWPRFNQCDIQGGWAGVGEGNIDADPEFIHPSTVTGPVESDAGLDWSILAGSPCYNTGVPDSSGSFVPDLDFAGNPRVYDGRMDIGAYEAYFNQVAVDARVCEADPVSFIVFPSGSGPFSYQWLHDDEPLPDSDSNSLVLDVTGLQDEGYYQSLVSCPEGDFHSEKVLLEIDPDVPKITRQPQGGLVHPGDSYTLSVSALPARNFQWYKNDTLLEGDTDSTLIVHDFSVEKQGRYKCLVENACGGVFSIEAILLIDEMLIKENETNCVTAYPNPAGNQLTVSLMLPAGSGSINSKQFNEGNNHPNFNVMITDLCGRKLMEYENVIAFPYRSDISSLAPGMYILHLMDKKGIKTSLKFQKCGK